MPFPIIAVVVVVVRVAAPIVIKVVVKQASKVIRAVRKKLATKASGSPKPTASMGKKPNTGPNKYNGKAKKKDNCKAALKKYPVHEHKDKKKHCNSKTHQSHHVQQNAQFMVGGKPISTICPGYKRDNAPCIPLKGK